MNRVTLMGRVGKDPEIRSFQNGDKVANFTLATSERWKDKDSGEKKERTEWHNISVTGPVVKVFESYVHKGDQLLIEGQLQTRKWQDQSGNDKYTTEVCVRPIGGAVHLIGGAKGDAPRDNDPAPKGQPRADLDDDSVPF